MILTKRYTVVMVNCLYGLGLGKNDSNGRRREQHQQKNYVAPYGIKRALQRAGKIGVKDSGPIEAKRMRDSPRGVDDR